MNLATIYEGTSNPASDLRRACLVDQFEEVGYMVEFRPRASRGTVWFRCRHQFSAKEYGSLWDLLEKRTAKKLPLDSNGCLPWKKITFKGLDTGATEYLPSVRSAGVVEWQSSWAEVDLEIYAAEAFARDCAMWLAEKHSEKWKWVCIEETKLQYHES